jgi:glycosyltransferase involved in cell wall biosynthesis
MSNSPLFSIVIPTHNRAHLISNALRSALNQQFDDYEIVIVANACKDNTREVVESMATKRVKYFETEKLLSLVDNWEFGWTKSLGQYVIYLSDDDALVPTALQCIADKALYDNPPIVSWYYSNYYYPKYSRDSRDGLQNVLIIHYSNDKLIEDVPSNHFRKSLSRFEMPLDRPMAAFYAINRVFFDQWRERFGRLFFPASGDSFHWIVSHICPFIRVIHRPLILRGIHDNAASSHNGGQELQPAILKAYGDINLFSESQLNISLGLNQLFAELQRVSAELAKCGITPEPLDFNQFIIAIAKNLVLTRDLYSNSKQHEDTILDKAKTISIQLYNEIKDILAQESTHTFEHLRELHKRTQKMALEYLPNVENAMQRHAGDLQCALCSLALRDEILVETNWAYLYLFGEALNVDNIYLMSLHVDNYYDLLVNCRKKQAEIKQHETNTNKSYANS